MAQEPDPDDDSDGGPPDDRPMSLFEHLEDLRKRLIRAILWLCAGTAIAYYFSEELIEFIKRPLKVAGVSVVQIEIGTTFFTALKASLAAGIFIGGPFILREIWAFVAPGLYPKERRWFVVFAPFSYLLFAAGGAFFYLAVQPVMLAFFLGFPGEQNQDIEQLIDIGRWFTLWLGMLAIMGIVFQLPLLMLAAAATGVVDAKTFREYRRHFIVGSVIAAAVLTPTGDAMTLSLTMIPILVLYELGVLLAWLVGRRKQEKTG